MTGFKEYCNTIIYKSENVIAKITDNINNK